MAVSQKYRRVDRTGTTHVTSTAQLKKQRLRLTNSVRASAPTTAIGGSACTSSRRITICESASRIGARDFSGMQETSVAQGFLVCVSESRRASCKSHDATRAAANERAASAVRQLSTGQFFCANLACVRPIAAIFRSHTPESGPSDSGSEATQADVEGPIWSSRMPMAPSSPSLTSSVWSSKSELALEQFVDRLRVRLAA
jgi:hypothetical protein